MNLCTLDNVKTFLSLTTSGSDVLLTELITRVSKSIESYCDRTFDSQSYTEYFDGGSEVFPSNYPITTVTSVHYDTNREYGTDDLIDSTYYTTIDSRSIAFDDEYKKYPNALKVVYTAGLSSVPEDLKQACIDEVARVFKMKEYRSIELLSDDKGSYTYITDNFLPSSKSIIDRYKRWVVL